MKREGIHKWFCSIDPEFGKVERAVAQTPKIERKYIYLPEEAEWLETFESEVAAFPFCKYLDQVDSMVHFLAFLDTKNRITNHLSAFPEQFKAV